MIEDTNNTNDKANIVQDIGLTYDKIRDVVSKNCGALLGPKDPDLIVVAILNAFLEKQAELQKKHEEALVKFMGSQTAQYAETVKKGAEDVTKTLSAITTQGLNEIVKDLLKFRTTLYQCTAVCFLSSLLIVGALVWRTL